MKIKKSDLDFKESSLPSNRKELFFDILKYNFKLLLKLGLILTLFAIPFICVMLLKDFYEYNSYAQFIDGVISAEQYKSNLLMNDLLFDAINCFVLGIFGLGIAGVIKIVKRLCFLEPVFFTDDLKSGIKDNGKSMFPLFFIFGLIILIDNFSANIISNKIISIIPLCITISIIIPILMICMISFAIYKVKFTKSIYVSFLLYVRTFFKTLLVYVCCLLPFAVLFIPNILIKWGIIIIILIIIAPIILVGLFDYCCFVFDKYINATQYPEIYRKGLIDKESKK